MKILTSSHANKPTLTDEQVSKGFLLLDITVKSGDELAWFLAPTWTMVNSWKNGMISWSEFSDKYFMLMSLRWFKLPNYKKEFLSDKKLILVCYCNEEVYCHRYLAADFLVKNAGATYFGEHIKN